MTQSRAKRLFLRILTRTVNPLALAAARSGHGPFSTLRHVGRRSGRTYETPLILARVTDGFVAELTYGDDVSWLRNLAATGRGQVISRGIAYRVTGVEPYPADAGFRAYPLAQRHVLKTLRKNDFRLIAVDDDTAATEVRPPST